MDKLELKHLAPYLPYGLKILRDGKVMALSALDKPYKTNDDYFVRGETKVVNGTYRQTTSFRVGKNDTDKFKPVLRPMSDLNIDDGAWASYAEEIPVAIEMDCVLEDLPYYIIEQMIANHYDVFGLIDKGLAIDINTLEF
jgi:hypothetical protein